MVSFNKLTRTLAGIAAAALIVPLAACGGSGNGGTATAEGIPAKGTDDGTEITLWTRSPLERQAKNVVEAYNKSHKNQVKLEIIPNDDMEGKVGGASQTDSLPDILAGNVVRIPYCFASMFVRQVRQCFSAVWADGFPRCRHRFPVM